ncbi:hypothetical protein PVAND_013928 [Polypedilum vanderplanki]|uniref:Uncharacterized protein n=1 Tax=Polypedilum vanderplanki TaxID=319348 RepID=A0A9J6CQV5_POLVA|nr:hypothetical protein PVAND_013928 [Polypedilum vanderplanki]
MKQQIIIILFFVIISVNCHFINHDTITRAKRSPEEGFFAKAKSGLSQFGSDVKKVAVKGYEEVKNLFSKDRKVGDYTLDKIDVRFGDDGEEELQETTENITIFEANTLIIEKEKVKRSIEDLEQEIKDTAKRDIVTEASSSKTSTLPNNAEVSPGYPPPMEIVVAPLTCQKNYQLENGECKKQE